ncbi:MAG TPA: ABC transporter permease [Opitutaceae bacterium]|nr:ABC transporter permease [Opitutaceae bacterium]
MKHAVRRLLASPGFTVTALITLALGIGVNTSMFTILNAMLLRPLGYAESDRLVRVYRTAPQSQSWPHAPANFLDQQARNAVFERMAALQWASFNLAGPGQPAERLRGMNVTADFFPLLGVQAAIGRAFGPEEDRPDKSAVVVLSHSFFVRRFAADPSIVGRDLRINGEPVRVLGVMPPHFEDRLLWGPVDAWRPLALTDQQREIRGTNYLQAIARLKAGVSVAQAQAAMTTLAQQLEKSYPQSNAGSGLRLLPLVRTAQDETGNMITWFIVGLAGFVLLIACANLANVQFARTAGRAREYAIRAALGASRGRIMRELLAESLLLGLVGGVLGVVIALWSNDLISRRIEVSDQIGFALPVDLRVLGFTLLVSMGSGVAFGLLPAWLASRGDVNDALKQGARGSSASAAQHRLRHALIVAEVAFALVLLAGAGFFIRGLQRFAHRELGWSADGVLAGFVSLQMPKYSPDAKRIDFYDRLETRLVAIPGVEHAAFVRSIPAWGYSTSNHVVVAGRPAPARGREPLVYVNTVSASAFEALGIRLVQGRNFTPADRAGQPAVVIINETMARALFPGESPIGKRLQSANAAEPNPREIVGVVNDVREASNLSEPETRFQLYRPHTQVPSGFTAIVLRSRIAPEMLGNELRRAVAEIDPDQPVHEIGTVRSKIELSRANWSLVTWLLGSFATLGVALAAVGIYGVISGYVVQRTNEIGIRVALGAQMRDILRLVLGQGLRLALLGTLFGLGGAFAVARLLRTIVPELPPADAVTATGVTALLIGIAALACWIPARNATRVNPMVALRAE